MRRGGRQRLGQSEVLPNAGSYVVRTAAGGSSTGCVIVQASPRGQPALSSRSMSCTSAELLAMFAASSASAPRLIIRCVRQLISGPSSTRTITVSFVVAFVSVIFWLSIRRRTRCGRSGQGREEAADGGQLLRQCRRPCRCRQSSLPVALRRRG